MLALVTKKCPCGIRFKPLLTTKRGGRPRRWHSESCRWTFGKKLERGLTAARADRFRHRICALEDCRKPFRPKRYKWSDREKFCSKRCGALAGSRRLREEARRVHYAEDYRLTFETRMDNWMRRRRKALARGIPFDEPKPENEIAEDAWRYTDATVDEEDAA